MFIVARWDDSLYSWMVCLGKEYFIFLHFSSLPGYLLPNVDLRLGCNQCISCILFGVRALHIFKGKEKRCVVFTIKIGHLFSTAVTLNIYSSIHSVNIHWVPNTYVSGSITGMVMLRYFR